ncbi:MAG: RHS repeat domain-containing protein, partial [Opitutaceae bacterium]
MRTRNETNMYRCHTLFGLVASLVLSLGAPGGLRAQASNIATVGVTYSVELQDTDYSYDPQFTIEFAGNLDYYNDSWLQSEPRTVQLEPGRPYIMVLSGEGDLGWAWGPINFDYRVLLSTADGQKVYVDGTRHGAAGSAYGTVYMTIVVGDSEDCGDCGPGRDYTLTTDETRVAWSISLGRSANGAPIDPLSLTTENVTSATFDRNELNFTAKASDVERVPAAGALRQIVLPAALVDVVDVTGGFEARFYTLAAKGALAGGVYQIQGGHTPYISYQFKSNEPGSGSPNSVSFTRVAATSETTLLQRDPGSGRWTELDPAYGTIETVRDSDTQETTTWRNADSSIARQVVRTYKPTVGAHRELVKERVEPAGAQAREHVWWWLGDNIDPEGFVTQTPYPGSLGKLNMSRGPDGNYAIYTYYNETGPAVGRIARVYRSYQNSPDGLNHGESVLQTGRWSEYFWAEDINGIASLLSERIDRVGALVVGRETATHAHGQYANGKDLVSSVHRTYSLGSEYTETTYKTYAPSPGVDSLYHDRLYAVIAPDRTQRSYVQQRGTWSSGVFTPSGSGDAWREISISGSADQQTDTTQMTSSHNQAIQPIWVKSGHSTMTVRILSGGNLVREELHICQRGASFEMATRIDREYTDIGVLQKETRLDPLTGQQVLLYESGWANNRLQWDRDAQGVRRSYTYDAKGRLQTETREGLAGGAHGLNHAQTTTYVYDAADQIVETTVTGGSGGTLVSKTKYDLGGYVIETVEPGGRETKYAYEVEDGTGYWKTTTTLRGGATRIERRQRDGRLLDISGTGVVADSFGHWLNGDGTESHGAEKYDTGGYTRHWLTDWTGRTRNTRAYRPDDGTFERWGVINYNAQGRLANSWRSGEPAVHRAYNPLLGWSAQGVDFNYNGALDYAGMDPISFAESYFLRDGAGAWWLVQAAGDYGSDNNDTQHETAATETRLCGYNGSELSTLRTRDRFGQVTTTTTAFDWNNKQLTTTTDLPHATNHEVSLLRNGRLAQTTTAQGLVYTFRHDQFGREDGRHDPRKGWTARVFYDHTNYVLAEADEADNAASRWTRTYGYDWAGRVVSTTNAAGKSDYFAYTSRGELSHQWGQTVHPVRYEYNNRGQRTKMFTYRDGSGWESSGLPAAFSSATADVTEWVYDANHGLLTEKRDAGWPADNSRKTSYTYTADGLVAARQWARLVPAGHPNAGQRVTTTYTYNGARQLVSITYNDGTPAVSYTEYNRRGQLRKVTDALNFGREYYYDAQGFLRHEQLNGFFGGRVLDWQRDAHGRRTRLGLHNQPDWPNQPQFLQDYHYSPATARLDKISSWSGATGYPHWRDSTYEYHANSNLTSWTRQSWAGHDVLRNLEPNRDLTSARDTYQYLPAESRTVVKMHSDFSRDILGRAHWHNKSNDWKAPAKNPLFTGFSSELHLAIQFAYNDRHEL